MEPAPLPTEFEPIADLVGLIGAGLERNRDCAESQIVELLIVLSSDFTCSVCSSSLLAGSQAFLDREGETATCRDCWQFAAKSVSPGETSLQGSVLGTAGASARRRALELRAETDERNLKAFGKLGHVVNAIRDDTPSTKAYKTGARGEERLGRRLEKRAGHDFIVLHDRAVPRSRSNIDHIVVARSGVYVIDTKHFKGEKVEKRKAGPIFSREPRLFIGGSDRTNLVRKLMRQIVQVSKALESNRHGCIPVYGFLCFVDAEWGFLGPPIRFDRIRVVWPRALIKAIDTAKCEEPLLVHTIAAVLAEAFPER